MPTPVWHYGFSSMSSVKKERKTPIVQKENKAGRNLFSSTSSYSGVGASNADQSFAPINYEFIPPSGIEGISMNNMATSKSTITFSQPASLPLTPSNSNQPKRMPTVKTPKPSKRSSIKIAPCDEYEETGNDDTVIIETR